MFFIFSFLIIIIITVEGKWGDVVPGVFIAQKSNFLFHNKTATKKDYRLLLLILPFIALVIMFTYVPLFGWIFAFFDYKPGVPLFKCEFVGLDYFKLILSDHIDMFPVMRNTIIFALLGYLAAPLPMIFGICLNEIKFEKFKKLVQTVTTFPNFISWTIVFSLAFQMFSFDGVVSNVLMQLGLSDKPYSILADAGAVYWFQTFIGLWKGLGWSAIIYLAAISGIEQEIYDVAAVDGAGRFSIIWHITIPSILPTFIVLQLLAISSFVGVGFDQFFIFKNPFVAEKIEVIDVYTYRIGYLNGDYSYGTAISVMKSVISISLLFFTNFLSKKIRGNSII